MQVSGNVCESNCFLENIGKNLRHYRTMNSLSQKQMAKALSMATISYSLIERGKAGTTLKTLYKIAQILDVSPAQLLLDKDEIFLTKKDIVALYARGVK